MLAFGSIQPKTGEVIAVMLKSLFETSKKVPLEHVTITLAVFVEILGTLIIWEPLLETLAASNVLKFNPPSIESRILTFAQDTGALSVPDTSQVTVAEPLPGHVIPEADGDVTKNGPELPSISIVIST